MTSWLKPAGLKTYDSELSPNSMENLNIADNIVIDVPNTVQKRRGFKEVGSAFGTVNDKLKQLLVYKDIIIRHFNTSLQFDSTGNNNFQTFSGTFNETSAGNKIKYSEANSNLYFTTSDGIKKISAETSSDFTTGAGYITDAGGVKAIDLNAKVKFTVAGFMPAQSKCAYRLVWGIRDLNNNVILGSPSERFVVTNTSKNINLAESFSVTINTNLPTDLSTDYILASSKNLDYVFWFDVTGTDSIPTAPSTLGRTSVRIPIIGLTSNTQIATAVSNIINSEVDFSTTIVSNVVTIDLTDNTSGDVTNASTSDAVNTTLILINNGSVTLGTTADVDVTFSIPSSILNSADKTQYFYQIYRTAASEVTVGLTLADIDPGDEMNLVLESPILSTDTSLKTVTDTTPETFRASGTLLYTNPISGGGINQSNNKPPIATDIALFRNTTFYSNTKTLHRKNIDLLSVTGFTSGTSNFIIKTPTTTNTYTFVGTTEVQDITIPIAITGTSVDGKHFLINSASNEYKYYVYFSKDNLTIDPSPANRTGIKVSVLSTDTNIQIALKLSNTMNALEDFSSSVVANVLTITWLKNGIVTNTSDVDTGFTILAPTIDGTGEDFANNSALLSSLVSPAQAIDETARSLVRVINADSTTNVYAFYLSGENDLPGKILLENRSLTDIQFNLTTTDINLKIKFNPELTGNIIDTVSTNDISKNRVYYSKTGQPESVPILNYLDIGPKDKPINRIIALRDNMFCLKEDGVYIITGSTAPNFGSRLLDRSTNVYASDTAVVLNNEIYCLSSQGVVKITETGVSIISRPIEDKIKEIMNSSYNYKTRSFGVSYESDRAYILWLQTLPTDTEPTQAYRYNTILKTWTRWTKPASCGVVNEVPDKLYIGSGTRNYLEEERKDRNRTDYADRDFAITLNTAVLTDASFGVSSVTDITKGDVVLQNQYITISQFNRLLLKLDKDSGLSDTDYHTLSISNGELMNTKLDALNLKLVNDDQSGTITSHSPFSTNFATMQTEYNLLISDLNNNLTDTVYKNYAISTGSISYEVAITNVVQATNTITGAYIIPLISGPITIFKGINSVFEFSEQYFDAPENLKQISEASLLINQNDFSSMTMSFKSDLSQVYESQEIFGEGIGNFGYVSYGNNTYGGAGTDVGARVLVPRDKQRCRYLTLKVTHNSAREHINCLGITMTPRIFSSRGYR